MQNNFEIIYGRQPVLELMRAERRSIKRILLFHRVRQSDAIKRIRKLAAAKKSPLENVDHPVLDRLTGGRNHQGVVVEAGNYPYLPWDNLQFLKNPEAPLLLLLDQIQDPQNLGAVLRSAETAGVDAVILPFERSAQITPAVVRVSAGASEYIAVSRVQDLLTAMRELREKGFHLFGLETGLNSHPYIEADFKGATAITVGSEGKGLRRKIRDACDTQIEIPLRGKVNSLNAATAAAITLYEVQRQRRAIS